MEVLAKLRFLRISPRKVRLVADVARGLPVEEAENQLTFIPRRAARPVLKLLRSAIANAVNNFKLTKENLFVKRITVDQGPTLKRWRPRAFGRAAEIMKRSSHITIVLDELKEPAGQKKSRKSATMTTVEKIAKERKPTKAKQPVVDFRQVKHESKFKKESGEEESSQKKKKSGFSFRAIKEKFTRRLGEK